MMKLIKLQDKFILVSDEEIKEGDLIFNKFGVKYNEQVISKASKNAELNWKSNMMINNGKTSIRSGIFKIISENPDFSLLSEEDCKTIGWINTWEHFKVVDGTCAKGEYEHWLFNRGFKTAQSLNDKMFSLDDMRKAFEFGLDFENGGSKPKIGMSIWEEFIESLQQTSWDVEVDKEEINEEETIASNGGFSLKVPVNIQFVPKITNNSIKVIKIL